MFWRFNAHPQVDPGGVPLPTAFPRHTPVPLVRGQRLASFQLPLYGCYPVFNIAKGVLDCLAVKILLAAEGLGALD